MGSSDIEESRDFTVAVMTPCQIICLWTDEIAQVRGSGVKDEAQLRLRKGLGMKISLRFGENSQIWMNTHHP